MCRLLIGLAGRARSGKSTASILLADMLALKLLTIADPVTLACAGALGMEHSNFLRLPKDYHLPGLDMSKRQFMQVMGDALISRNPDALIFSLGVRLEDSTKRLFLFNGHLITDIRTEAEAAWCRSRGGSVIHIRRATQEPSCHRTEQVLNHVEGDFCLHNDGSIEDFRSRCENLGHHFLQKIREAG